MCSTCVDGGDAQGLVFVVCMRLRWVAAMVGSDNGVIHLPPMAKERWEGGGWERDLPA